MACFKGYIVRYGKAFKAFKDGIHNKSAVWSRHYSGSITQFTGYIGVQRNLVTVAALINTMAEPRDSMRKASRLGGEQLDNSIINIYVVKSTLIQCDHDSICRYCRLIAFVKSYHLCYHFHYESHRSRHNTVAVSSCQNNVRYSILVLYQASTLPLVVIQGLSTWLNNSSLSYPPSYLLHASAPTTAVSSVNHGLRARHLMEFNIGVLGVLEQIKTEETPISELTLRKIVAVVPVVVATVCITQPDITKLRLASLGEPADTTSRNGNIELIVSQVPTSIGHLDNHLLPSNRSWCKGKPIEESR